MPSYQFLLGHDDNHLFMSMHPRSYFYKNSTGKCAFKFVGTDSLIGKNMYIFGAPAYRHYHIVHRIDTRQMGFKAVTGDVD